MATAADDFLAAALAYAARGWRVFPAFEIGADGRCACGKKQCADAGKHPRTPHGFKNASANPAQIRAWWTEWPDANVAIATGAVSGLVVVDVDVHKGGDAGLDALERRLGALPPTCTARTGHGGRHLYFAHPGDGGAIQNAVDVLGVTGVDIRGDGGYVVAPPSRNVGGLYSWLTYAMTPAALPATWLEALVRRTSARAADARTESESPCRSRCYPQWLPERISVGTRHKMLPRLAGWLRGYGYNEAGILAELRELMRTRVEQPADDAIPEAWIAKLARAMARKPIKHFGLRDRYEGGASTWKGRAGRTDRRVLFSYVLPTFARYMKLGERIAPLPSLSAANAADVSDGTAANSLKRLCGDRRVLRRAGRRARDTDAQRYQLVPPPRLSRSDEGRCSYRAERSSAPSSLRESATLLREIFRHEALGHVAGVLHGVLREESGQRPMGLRVDGCALSSVYRALGRMADHGLAVKAADGWRRVALDRDALIAVARALGVLGKTAAEYKRRKLKRAIYRQPASARRRQRQRDNRVAVQQQLLDAAAKRGWPTIDAIVGETGWRRFAKSTRTRAFWPMCARLRKLPERNLSRESADLPHDDAERYRMVIS